MILPGRKKLLMTLIWNWILGWFGLYAQVQPDCDFTYYLSVNQQQILQNPGFDQGQYYGSGRTCRWRYSSPPGTYFDVTCNPIDMPRSNQCQYDRLVISTTGHPTLSDGQNFCGTGTAKLQSVSNSLSIGLISAPSSNGGRYRCIITALVGGSGTLPPPTTTSTTTQRPNTCDCGWRQQRRIVGGTETKVNEFVFMAAVIDMSKRIVWCGASIISANYAVSAAHCFRQAPNGNFGLLVGDHNIAQGFETDSSKLYLIAETIIHSQYSSTTQQNDIALVRTSETMQFNMNVGPICLPYRYTDVDFTRAPVTAMGWGTTFFTGPTSDALLAVNLTVVSQSECQKSYTDPNERLSPQQLCTSGADTSGNNNHKDTCTYDSGGPVVWFDNWNTYRYQLLAIISFGKACGTFHPSVNTKVPSYVSWIINSAPNEFFCFK